MEWMIKLLCVCYSLRPWSDSVMKCGGLRVQATLKGSALWRARGLEQHLRRMFRVGWQPGHINQIIFSFFSGLLHFQKLHLCCIPMKHLRFPTRLRFPSGMNFRKHNNQSHNQHKRSRGCAGGVRWERTIGKPNLKEQNESHLHCVSFQLLQNTHLGMCNSSFQ